MQRLYAGPERSLAFSHTPTLSFYFEFGAVCGRGERSGARDLVFSGASGRMRYITRQIRHFR